MQEDFVKRLMRHYGLEVHRVGAFSQGYRNTIWPVTLNDGRIVALILYKNDPDILVRIKAAHAVSRYLVSRGLPVRAPLSKKIATIRTEHGTRYAGLYTYLPGSTIPWEGYTQKHIKLLGKTLSDMHALLRECPATGIPSVTAEYLAILERMQIYFSREEIIDATQRKLNVHVDTRRLAYLGTIIRALENHPKQIPLHMDFVRGNILFDDDSEELRISGIVDFEKTAIGHPLFDIARTLAFLLVDCKYTSQEKVRKYFLYSGYHKRGAMHLPLLVGHSGATDISILEILTELFLVYDFYKFLRHNPYESLAQNEHYVRTRDILLKQSRVIKSRY